MTERIHITVWPIPDENDWWEAHATRGEDEGRAADDTPQHATDKAIADLLNAPSINFDHPKHRQVGPPVRFHNYLVRVIDDSTDVLAQAVHVPPAQEDDFDEEARFFPESVSLTPAGLVVDDSSGIPCLVPSEVLQALLKVGGWKVETP